MSLSVVVITKNEEKNIARCLESVKWADEIIIIDSNSTDSTIDIARKYTNKILTIEWTGFGNAKREGVSEARFEWILSIDADEVITPLLKEEIIKVVSTQVEKKDNPNISGYYINRKTNFLGKWINHSNWYPDYVLRLFKKDEGNVNTATIHEAVIVDGATAYLKNDMHHFSYPTFELYLEKFNLYTTMGAEKAFQEKKKPNIADITVRPLASFLKHYIIKQGFRDGYEGFIISIFSSLSVFVKQIKLFQIYREKN